MNVSALRFQAFALSLIIPASFACGGNRPLTLWSPIRAFEKGSSKVAASESIQSRRVAQESVDSVPRAFPVPQSVSVIITSEKLKAGAELLKKFHQASLGIESAVVIVEEIEKSYGPLSDADLPTGYATEKDRDDYVIPFESAVRVGYHWARALKILSFTRNLMVNGKTKYLTLLGDADQIPPSYYFAMGSQIDRFYGVTDMCYAATDRCLKPVFALGRLPFSEVSDVSLYINKVRGWLPKAATASVELSVLGGKAFPSNVYLGELGAIKALEAGGITWSRARKYFRTLGNYNRNTLRQLIDGKLKTLLAYHLDHGFGNELTAETESITSDEISKISAIVPSGLPPVILSISCSNAAFDPHLVREPVFGKPDSGTESVGVAMIKSHTGAVAYLGVPRPAIGTPVYNIDKHGNLTVTETTEALLMMHLFLEKYASVKVGRLGDFLFGAQYAYAFESSNDMDDEAIRYSYFNLTLLGDPVLPLPSRFRGTLHMGIPRSEAKFTGAPPDAPPYFEVAKDTLGMTAIPFRAGGPVNVTLLRQLIDPFGFNIGEKIVGSFAFDGSDKMPLKLDGLGSVGSYFMRIENTMNTPTERQVWFDVREK